MCRNLPWPAVGLVVVLLSGAGGCGPGRFDVAGKVTYNGAPLDKPDGQIVFVGPAGDQVAAAVGADGAYRATGVAAGPNRVAVYYPNPNAMKGKGAKPRSGEAPPPAPPFLTPAKYAAAETSGLSVAVDRGTTFDAALTGPPVR